MSPRGAKSPDEGSGNDGTEPVHGPYRRSPATSGRLHYKGGVSRLELHSNPDLEGLFEATFKGPKPEITERDGTVRIESIRTWPWQWHKMRGDVTLRAGIPWEIAFKGGASEIHANLASLDIRGFEITGGASEVDLDLGRAVGTATIHIGGGVSGLRIRRPLDVAIRVRIGGGASELSLDEFHFGAVGGKVSWESHGYAEATNRYDLEITGGASELRIGTRP
jgi:hypothetical protein